jgi:hypothetical protein
VDAVTGPILFSRWLHTSSNCPNAAQLASQLLFKELFIKGSELEALGNDASGAVDFIVMRTASKIVGVDKSSFSRALKEYRELLDRRPETDSMLVHIPRDAEVGLGSVSWIGDIPDDGESTNRTSSAR